MIESIARRISVKISNAAQNEVSVNVMSYALGVYLNFFIVVILSGVVGLVTGHFVDTMLAMAGFGFLRVLSGGFHLKSLTACAAVSILLFGLIPLIHIPGETLVLIVTLISVVLTALFSPSFRHFPQISGRKRLNFKIISIIVVSVNICLLSSSLALAFLAQSITLIHIGGVSEHE